MSTNRRALVFSALLILIAGPALGQPSGITVFAAASLTDSLKQVAQAYHVRSGVTVTLSFGASSSMARQIDQGAPADVFVSADQDWMDYLQKRGRIAAGTRKVVLRNALVLIAAKDQKAFPKIAPHFDLARALGDGRLAMADPTSVPAGKYGKAALTSLGVWNSVASKVVQAENVRVALEYVARGEAPLGIVYATDARVAPVRVVGVFPENTHPAILYPAALIKGAGPAARSFLSFLSSPQAQAIFRQAGFRTP